MYSQIGINMEHDVNIHLENRLKSKHLNPYMKWDKSKEQTNGEPKAELYVSTAKPFWISGLGYW